MELVDTTHRPSGDLIQSKIEDYPQEREETTSRPPCSQVFAMDRSDLIPDEVKAGDIEKAGQRFAADIRALREARGIPLSLIHAETRVSERVLKEFETTGLTTNEIFNRVYLRSLVISYSGIVGLNPDDALLALEAALDGSYETGQLAAEEEPTDRASAVDRASGPEPEHQEIGLTEDVDAVDIEGSDDDADDGGDAPTESDVEAASGGGRLGSRFEFIPTSEREEVTATRAESGDGASPRVKTEISTAVHDFKPPEDHKGVIVLPNRFRAIALGALVVVVSVSAIFMAIRLSNRVADEPPAPGASALDTIEPQEVAALPPDPIPAVPTIVLGDSVAVTLVAEGGPLDPVRVQIDTDLRRPYWIDQGDSLQFGMARRIVIQDLLSRLVVKLEGLPYPTGSYSDSDRVVITRDSVEAFVESLGSR